MDAEKLVEAVARGLHRAPRHPGLSPEEGRVLAHAALAAIEAEGLAVVSKNQQRGIRVGGHQKPPLVEALKLAREFCMNASFDPPLSRREIFHVYRAAKNGWPCVLRCSVLTVAP